MNSNVQIDISHSQLENQYPLKLKLFQGLNKFKPSGLYDNEIQEFGENQCLDFFQKAIIRSNLRFRKQEKYFFQKNFESYLKNLRILGYSYQLDELFRLLNVPSNTGLAHMSNALRDYDIGEPFYNYQTYKKGKKRRLIQIRNKKCPYADPIVRNQIKRSCQDSNEFRKKIENLSRKWRKERRGKLFKAHSNPDPKELFFRQEMEKDIRYQKWLQIISIMDRFGIRDRIEEWRQYLRDGSNRKRINGKSFEKINVQKFLTLIVTDLSSRFEEFSDSTNFSYMVSSKWREIGDQFNIERECDLIILFKDQIVAVGEMKRNVFDIPHVCHQHKKIQNLEKVIIEDKIYSIRHPIFQVYIGTRFIYDDFPLAIPSQAIHVFNKGIQRVEILLHEDKENCDNLYQYIRDQYSTTLTQSPIKTLQDYWEYIFVLD